MKNGPPPRKLRIWEACVEDGVEDNVEEKVEEKVENEVRDEIPERTRSSNINWSMNNYYTSLMNEFSSLINRNINRPYLSGTTIQYQTIPLGSYTNTLNNWG